MHHITPCSSPVYLNNTKDVIYEFNKTVEKRKSLTKGHKEERMAPIIKNINEATSLGDHKKLNILVELVTALCTARYCMVTQQNGKEHIDKKSSQQLVD